jgi:hypothetical protein
MGRSRSKIKTPIEAAFDLPPLNSASNGENNGRNGRSHFRHAQQDAAHAGLLFLSSAVKPQAELSGKWFLDTFCQNKKYLPPKVKAKRNSTDIARVT